MTQVVRAAGGLVFRNGGSEVLVVHRDRYDDWSFPKGKAMPGESDEDCALREVEEETGLRCALEEELPATEYIDAKGRPKRVRYWLMQQVGGEISCQNEVDVALWVPHAKASRLLTYQRDVELLRSVDGSRLT